MQRKLMNMYFYGAYLVLIHLMHIIYGRAIIRALTVFGEHFKYCSKRHQQKYLSIELIGGVLCTQRESVCSIVDKIAGLGDWIIPRHGDILELYLASVIRFRNTWRPANDVTIVSIWSDKLEIAVLERVPTVHIVYSPNFKSI